MTSARSASLSQGLLSLLRRQELAGICEFDASGFEGLADRRQRNRVRIRKNYRPEHYASGEAESICNRSSWLLWFLHSAYFLKHSPAMTGAKLLILLASPTGFEPVTPRLGIWCSILLSYEDIRLH